MNAPLERRTENVETIATVSPMQQGILFHSLRSKETDPYLYQLAFVVRGELDAAALERAWAAAAARHQVLRAEYRWEETPTPVSVIYKTRSVALRRLDYRDAAPAEQHERLGRLLAAERQAGFDFRAASDLRLTLIQIAERERWLIWTYHHIALDGWSASLVLGDVIAYYHHFASGAPAPEGKALPFSAYLEWLKKQDPKRALGYFQGLLAGVDAATPLPRAPEPSGAPYAELALKLPAASSERIAQQARAAGVTVNTLIQGAWALLLGRYAGTRDVVFGATVSGRSAELPGVETSAGLFINTLPVRVSLPPAVTVRCWLEGLQRQNLESRRHEHTPLVEIRRQAGLSGDDGLFESVLVFDNTPVERVLAGQPSGLVVAPLRGPGESGDISETTGRNNYPLTLNVQPGSELGLHLAYQCACFSRARIGELGVQLRHLLEQLAERLDAPLGELGLAVVAPAPRAAHGAPPPASVLERFAAQVAARPTAVAVQHESATLTFAELDAAADRVAAALRARGVAVEDRVGLATDRSLDLVVGLLGVLRAGAAYVPLDAKLPARRLAELYERARLRLVLAAPAALETARAAATLTTAPDAPAASAAPLDVLPIAELLAVVAAPSLEPLAVHPAQAAYIIFTSGSTGTPKGVLVSHGALASYTSGLLERLGLDASASMAMVSTVSADLGHTALFGALCAGATLHLISEERAFDPDAFADYMGRHEVGVLKIVPSHLRALLHARQPARALPAAALIVGGEATDWELCERARALRPGCRVINHYGPTEATVGVSTHGLPAAASDPAALDGQRAWSGSLPIGRALPDVDLHVLDLDGQRVPAGVAAELYIGGGRLARGYFGNPAVTAERFVPDGSGLNPGGRLYRTGDRVRRGPDGALEFLGRMDRQVKIRGYRVELGEIEARLSEHEGVREALVITRAAAGGHAQLVAYVVPRAAEPAALGALSHALAEHLARALPDYMVPSHVLLLERLPLTGNGKIDRKALPEPDALPSAAPTTDELEVSPVEQQLIEVWKEVLRVPTVRVGDNFFSLGGDSILSLQVIARARRRGLKVTPKQLFERPTIRGLAAVVVVEPARAAGAAAGANGAPTIGVGATAPGASAPEGAEVPLLPLQARFFSRDVPEPGRYNQSLLLTPRAPLDATALEAALRAVVEHHPALRARFRRAAGAWSQTIVPVAAERGRSPREPLLWVRRADDERGVEAIADAAQGSLQLEQGPLLRAALIDWAGREQRLFIAAHHLVVDGVSWRVLLEDLELAYRQAQSGAPIELPAATASPAEWATALARHACTEAVRSELDHWLAQVEGGDALVLRRDHPEGSLAARSLASVDVRLDRITTDELLKDAPEAYRTRVNDLLLTALARAVCRRAGIRSVLIELEGHGREPLADAELDLSRTVGWLTSAFPVRLTPDLGADGKALGASIKAIKEQLRRAPHHGLGYGVSRYLGDAATRARLAAAPEPRITFNYLGQFDQSFDEAALLVPAREGTGRSESLDAPLANWLSVEGRVYQGELALSFAYSREVYRAETIEAVAAACRAELEAIVAHTAGGASGVTPSDFPLAGLDQAKLDGLGLLWNEVEDLYPLTPMQEGMLMHTLLEPGSGIYLMQHDHRIEALIDLALFRRAWEHVAERHHVLRTSFVYDDEGMRQVVRRYPEVAIEHFDWRHLDAAGQEAELERVLEAELGQGFDMQRGPLWRVRLARTGEAAYRFVFSNHHILMDAWGRAVLLQDVFSAYQALAAGQRPALAERAPFRDFIAWLLQSEASESTRYWQRVLSGFERATPLPSDRSLRRRVGLSVIGDVETFLGLEQTAALERLVGESQLTLNTLVQAAWALTLVRASGQREVLFGVTVAGRPVERPELEQTVGLFINSIPLRVRLPSPATTTRAWLGQLLQQNAEMRQHEHLPLVEIQEHSDVSRGQPLFDSLFVFENAPIDVELLESAEAMSASAIGGRTHTNYPITVVVYPGDRLGLHLSYDTRFFERATIEGLLAELERLLFAIAAGLDRPLAELPILPEGERDRLLEDWTQTRVDHPLSQGYVPLFEAQVKKTPERVAAASGAESLRYAELDADAEAIGWALRDAGAGPDALVAILSERSLALLRAVVGTLKAGAAYLPLDPRHPAQRLGEILAQSRPVAVLCSRGFEGVLADALARVPAAERPPVLSLADLERRERPRQRLGARATATSLAYVIYTSGSTGVPKGVGVEQAGMCNNQLSKIPLLGLTGDDVIAQTASQCFDISVWQLLTGLLCGARVEIVPDAVVQDPAALVRHVRDTGISVIELVPSVLQAMLDVDEGLPGCRVLLSTGEALPSELARSWLARAPGTRLLNAYGPAECSDDVAIGSVDAESLGRAPYAPIGRATDNLRLYVLDAELSLVPIGVTGELCVAGVGVGRGYHREPARTAEAFLPNPFARSPGERLYRTGDLARYRADGTLEYVGRADHQVKIRGYRIELGEIEARLRQHAAVGDAVVVASEGPSGKRLVAYVVPAERGRAAAGQGGPVERVDLVRALLEHLGQSLPDYMVPSLVLLLDRLPLSRSGKVDRKALPAPEWPDAEAHVEPRSELGKQLAAIWRRSLGAPRVGAHDNFFELGGNSLSATQVIARIRRELRLNVPLRHLFETDTLEDFERAVLREGYRLDAARA